MKTWMLLTMPARFILISVGFAVFAVFDPNELSDMNFWRGVRYGMDKLWS